MFVAILEQRGSSMPDLGTYEGTFVDVPCLSDLIPSDAEEASGNFKARILFDSRNCSERAG